MKTIYFSDGTALTYELERKAVKNINMRVGENGIVRVSANRYVKTEEIEAALEKHREFFRKAVKRQQSAIPVPALDSIRWLGATYPIVAYRSSREQVLCENGELRIFSLMTTPEEIYRAAEQWRQQQFTVLCRELNEQVRGALISRGLNPPPTRITIKDMQSRWGSCSYYRGHISINYRLAEYPRETVLSVFWHEYAHYWHHDHSARFYAFLETHYPEYRRWNNLLKQQ